jgi:hypothetical protein
MPEEEVEFIQPPEVVTVFRLGRPDSFVIVIPKKFAEALKIEKKAKAKVQAQRVHIGKKVIKRLIYEIEE